MTRNSNRRLHVRGDSIRSAPARAVHRDVSLPYVSAVDGEPDAGDSRLRPGGCYLYQGNTEDPRVLLGV